jgi:hypothetical protein
MSYTQTEEKWLQHKFQQFETQFQSVEPPAELISDTLNLFLYGAKVPRSFLPTWMNVLRERVSRVLKIHPEFLELSDFEQV